VGVDACLIEKSAPQLAERSLCRRFLQNYRQLEGMYFAEMVPLQVHVTTPLVSPLPDKTTVLEAIFVSTPLAVA
jgi:hypothetical protein